MRKTIGTVCMGLGTVLVLAALSLFVWNRYEDRQAGEAAREVLPQLIQEIAPQPAQDPCTPEMTAVEIDEYGYIGCLDIPAIGLELPVMAECDDTRLKTAPCRYAGSTKTDNLVIAGHNYTRHFGALPKLAPGDRVLFTDMDGNTWGYEVTETEVLPPTAVTDMTAGGCALTLFTCNYSGNARIAIRCDHVTGEI